MKKALVGGVSLASMERASKMDAYRALSPYAREYGILKKAADDKKWADKNPEKVTAAADTLRAAGLLGAGAQ